MRRLSLDLYPPQLDELGLDSAVRAFVRRSYADLTPPIAFEFESGPDPLRLSAANALAAYRIAQEAIANAVRHAGASRIHVSLRAQPEGLLLSVADDGKGFDASSARDRALERGSLGILSMEERARLAGGELTVRSTVQSGTTVSARLPA